MLCLLWKLWISKQFLLKYLIFSIMSKDFDPDGNTIGVNIMADCTSGQNI